MRQYPWLRPSRFCQEHSTKKCGQKNHLGWGRELGCPLFLNFSKCCTQPTSVWHPTYPGLVCNLSKSCAQRTRLLCTSLYYVSFRECWFNLLGRFSFPHQLFPLDLIIVHYEDINENDRRVKFLWKALENFTNGNISFLSSRDAISLFS